MISISHLIVGNLVKVESCPGRRDDKEDKESESRYSDHILVLSADSHLLPQSVWAFLDSLNVLCGELSFDLAYVQ